MTPKRQQILELGLALIAVAIATPLGEPEAGSSLAFARGSALLAFWLLSSARVGAFVARYLDDRGDRADTLLRSFLYSYLYVVLSLLVAGLLHGIDTLFLTVLNATCFVLVSASRSRLPQHPAASSKIRLLESMRSAPLITIVLALLAGIAVVNTAWAFLSPVAHPDDFTYHLVFPVEWSQTHTLSNRLVPFCNHSHSYHPKNTELIFTWLFLPLRSFAHIALAQLAFVLVTISAVADILRRCGITRPTAWTVAMLYWSSPVVSRFLSSGTADLAFACLFILAIRALLILRQRPQFSNWVDLSVIIGLFLGTKSFGILFVLLVLLPFGLLLLSSQLHRLAQVPLRRTLGRLSILLSLTIAGGGWWQLRNLIETGNPLFPMQVEILGYRLFTGSFGRTALGVAKPERLLELFADSVWLLIALGGVWTLSCLLMRRGGSVRVTWIAALGIVLPATLALVFWKLMPTGYSRFVLAAVPLGAMLLAVPLDTAVWPRRIFRLLLLVAVLLVIWESPIIFPLYKLGLAKTAFVVVAFTSSVIGLVLIALAPWLPYRRTATLSAIVSAVAILWFGTQTSNPEEGHLQNWLQNRWQPYLKIRQDYGPARIAFTGTNTALYSFGRDYANPVKYVNVNATGDALFHEHFQRFEELQQSHQRDSNGVAFYRGGKSYDAWAKNLSDFAPDFLIVSRMPGWARKRDYERDPDGFPVERRWADQHPERFDCVLHSARTRVYKVLE